MISDLVHGVGGQRVAALGILQQSDQIIGQSDVLQERHQVHSSEGKKQKHSEDRERVLATREGRASIYGRSHFMAA